MEIKKGYRMVRIFEESKWLKKATVERHDIESYELVLNMRGIDYGYVMSLKEVINFFLVASEIGSGRAYHECIRGKYVGMKY